MPNRSERLRLEVVYLALQRLDAQALIEELGQGKLLPAARNGKIKALAQIVDDALAEEVERRRDRHISKRVAQIQREKGRRS